MNLGIAPAACRISDAARSLVKAPRRTAGSSKAEVKRGRRSAHPPYAILLASVIIFIVPACADAQQTFVTTELGNSFVVREVRESVDALGLHSIGTGVYLKNIQSPSEHALVYESGIVESVTLRPYVGLPDNASFAAAIAQDAQEIRLEIPQLDAEYEYQNGELEQHAQDYEDIFAHTGAIRVPETNLTLYRLDSSLLGQSVLVTLRSDSDDAYAMIANSTADLIGGWEDGKGYLLASKTNTRTQNAHNDCVGTYGPTCKYQTNIRAAAYTGFIPATSPGNLYWEAAYQTEKTYRDYTYANGMSGCPMITRQDASEWTQLLPEIQDKPWDRFRISSNSLSFERDGTVALSAVYDRSDWTTLDNSLLWSCRYSNNYGEPILQRTVLNMTLNVWDRGFRHDSADVIDQSSPYSIPQHGPLYLIVHPHDAEVEMIAFDASQASFHVTGLPQDAPYVIRLGSEEAGAGVTDSSGTIRQSLDTIGGVNVPGIRGTLHLYPDAPYIQDSIGMAVFDMLHGKSLNFNSQNAFAYVPTVYARMVFPAEVNVDSVALDDIRLEYLAGRYAKNGALMIPILPGTQNVHIAVNGMDVSLEVADIRTEGHVRLLGPKNSTVSKHAVGGASGVASDASSSAFAIATSHGTMTADISALVSGTAVFSMNSTYDIASEPNRCWRSAEWHPPAIDRIGYSCSIDYWPFRGISPERWHANHHGEHSLEIREIRDRMMQQGMNSEYQRNVRDALNALEYRPLLVLAETYKNGEHADTARLYGAGNPVPQVTASVKGLQADYWTDGQINVNQFATIRYEEGAPRGIVSLDVESGDMVEFVVRVHLYAQGLPAAVSPQVTPDPRLHLAEQTEHVIGYAGADTRIHGGTVSIFCCSR